MTICVKCQHHWHDPYGYIGYGDCCLAHRNPAKYDPVTGRDTTWPKYKPCRDVNKGNCPLFKAKPKPRPEPPKLRWWERLLGIGE